MGSKGNFYHVDPHLKNLCRPANFGGNAVFVKLPSALCECIDILTGPYTHAACVCQVCSPCPLFLSHEWYWDDLDSPPTHTADKIRINIIIQSHWTTISFLKHGIDTAICQTCPVYFVTCYKRLTVRPARSRKLLMAWSCSWGWLRSRRTCSRALALVCSVFRVQMASYSKSSKWNVYSHSKCSKKK